MHLDLLFFLLYIYIYKTKLNMRNVKHSDETKKKISQSLLGKKKSYETRMKMSASKKEEWSRAKAYYNHTTMDELLGKNNNDDKKNNA